MAASAIPANKEPLAADMKPAATDLKVIGVRPSHGPPLHAVPSHNLSYIANHN